MLLCLESAIINEASKPLDKALSKDPVANLVSVDHANIHITELLLSLCAVSFEQRNSQQHTSKYDFFYLC